MPRWTPVHPLEPNGSSPDRARAHIQHRLLVAAELERASASEVDRLSAIAAGQGWTDHELAELLRVDLTTVRHRRANGFQRKRRGRQPQEQVL
jgi:hypothetical protein